MAVARFTVDYRGNSPALYGIISLSYFALLLFLSLRLLSIDAFGSTATGLELVGFALCYALGSVLIFYSIIRRHLMADIAIIACFLISYIAITALRTSLDPSLSSLLAPRYGILNWFIIGIGAASAISYIEMASSSRQVITLRRLFIVLGVLLITSLSGFSFIYLNSPFPTLSYQSASDNLIVMVIISMMLTKALWREGVPVTVALALIVSGTLAVAAVARMQSTSIVAFWSIALVLYFWNVISKLNRLYKYSLVIAAAVSIGLYLSSDLFIQTIEGTRFANLIAGEGLSSINARLDILSSFGSQFAVSPVFGHFSAEIVSGAGSGNYPHTLFSFLTHSGLIGTAMVGALIVLIYMRRLPWRRLGSLDLHLFLLMSGVLMLGMAYTFMTWPVFWFMIGLMCKRPTFKTLGEAR